MTVRSRFIKSVIDTAKTDGTEMPWSRRSARRKMILRREENQTSRTPKKAATA